jgi:hypothetical protein
MELLGSILLVAPFAALMAMLAWRVRPRPGGARSPVEPALETPLAEPPQDEPGR